MLQVVRNWQETPKTLSSCDTAGVCTVLTINDLQALTVGIGKAQTQLSETTCVVLPSQGGK